MSEYSKSTYASRINAILELLEENELDALIVTHDDEYLSYEVNDDKQRLKYLTGFSGSAGYAVIARNYNPRLDERGIELSNNRGDETQKINKCYAIFVDGRYVVQVKEQVDTDLYITFDFQDVSPSNYLCTILEKNATVGIDTKCISYKEFLKLEHELRIFNLKLVDTKENYVDKIWPDRPQEIVSTIKIFNDEFNGCPSSKKRENLAQRLRDLNYDATVITNPESICWLLNIRGHDRKFLPIINSRVVAYSNDALEWYINPEHFVDHESGEENLHEKLHEHIGHVDIFPESDFDDVLSRLNSSNSKVFLDPQTTNAYTVLALEKGGANLTLGLGLCEQPKSIKNHIEIAGEYKAHIKDGIAMCRFFCWLDNLTKVGASENDETYVRRVEETSEADLAHRAEMFRKVETGYIEPSFATISAIGSNAAMCHYNHEEVKEPRHLGHDSIYLIDSGAHYQDGTTDITRTVLISPHIPSELRKMYTLVLKCHIALATLIFPKGTTGEQIDAIARRSLWDYGFDFAHGTGHGVGHVLSVHEGPQRISSRMTGGEPIPLEPGMIISNEPGFYKEGEYGIRLENLMVVMSCSQPGLSHMLCFSPLTLVPFDNRFIIRELLSQKEIDWLNSYHQNVNNVIVNAATSLGEDEVAWLNKVTDSI